MACSGTFPNFTAALWSDVQLCHDTTWTDGTTQAIITVTPGTYNVNYTTTITKHVKVICGGVMDTCEIVNNMGDNGLEILNLTESSFGNTELNGFWFARGTGVQRNHSVVQMIAGASGQPMLITNNHFDMYSDGNVIRSNTNKGVISNNSLEGRYYTAGGTDCYQTVCLLRAYPQTPGMHGVSYFGSADTDGDQAQYIESNTLSYASELIDVGNGSRQVFRFNTVTNSASISHDGGDPSGRSIEIYKNTFVLEQHPADCVADGNHQARQGGWIFIRAGTALIMNNVLPLCCSTEWGGGMLLGLGFMIEILQLNHGPHGCWTAAEGYPTPYNPGWGYTTGATTVGRVGSMVAQDLEPIYIANNIGGGNYTYWGYQDYGSGGGCGAGPWPTTAEYVQANRDYYNQTDSGFDGTSGTGSGLAADMPDFEPCTPGVGFWVTDEGSWNTQDLTPGTPGYGKGQGQLYRCNSSNVFELYYTPYMYPHPLAAGAGTPPIEPPPSTQMPVLITLG